MEELEEEADENEEEAPDHVTSREDLEEEHDEEDLDAMLKTQICSAMGLMTQITQNPRFADFMKVPKEPVAPANPAVQSTGMLPLVGDSNFQHRNPWQQPIPQFSTHPGYFGGSSVFQAMAGSTEDA